MFKQLAHIRKTGQGSVTYNFTDESKQVSQINSQIFFTKNGKFERLDEVVKIFQTTAHDLKAISFEF